MEEMLRAGKIRAIGACNHSEKDLDHLLLVGTIPPAVDQVEMHPRLQRPALRDYCAAYRIRMQAWAPLMRGRAGTVPELVQIGTRHGKTPAQVSLRWLLQHGVTVIPKSVHPARISENADVFDFELSDEEMEAIDCIDRASGMGIMPEITLRLNGLTRRVTGR